MQGVEPQSNYALSGEFLAGRMRGDFPPEDLAYLEAQLAGPRTMSDGERIVASGETVTCSRLLVDGFAFRTIRKGGRRFIVGLNVPGDFVDLHGFALKHLDHDIVAAGPVQVAEISHQRLRQVTEERTELARALWFATLMDGAIHRQWIRNLEALDAPQRIAHLYAEVHHRLRLIGRNVSRTLRTPFTQTDLADMCGVSAIHANRAVARIRELGLGEIRRGDLYIGDWAALEAYAEFDPAYLYGEAGVPLAHSG